MMINLQAAQRAVDGSELIAPQSKKQRGKENQDHHGYYGTRSGKRPQPRISPHLLLQLNHHEAEKVLSFVVMR